MCRRRGIGVRRGVLVGLCLSRLGDRVQALLLQSRAGVAQGRKTLREAGALRGETRGLCAGHGEFVAGDPIGSDGLFRGGGPSSLGGRCGSLQALRGAADLQSVGQTVVLTRTHKLKSAGAIDEFLRVAGIEDRREGGEGAALLIDGRRIGAQVGTRARRPSVGRIGGLSSAKLVRNPDTVDGVQGGREVVG